MTTRDVTITGFALLCAAGAVLVVTSWLRNERLARFGAALTSVTTRHMVLRVLVVFVWAWLGWHFLARTG